MNSLCWDKNISLETRKQLGKAMVKSVACYGCEVWLQRKLLALEMNYLRRSARCPDYKKIPKRNRTINFREKSKKAIEMVWTPSYNGR